MGRPYEPEDISPAQTEPATSLRVPFINSPHPRWFYVTAIVVSTEPHLWFGQTPTEDEVRAVASFNDEYREHWYRDSYKARMREFAPYDIDGGAVGRYLIKHQHGGWGYRLHTWQHEARPTPRDEPMSLLAVMDRYHTLVDKINPRWIEWKAEHPEVFAPVAELTA